MYHMNPETGQISLCAATLRTCKYSRDDHFATWGEAQMAQDFRFADEYPALPTHYEVQKHLERARAKSDEEYSEYAELIGEKENMQLAICKTSPNMDLLTAVFNREILVTDDYRYIKAVLENKYFPDEIKENIAKYPNVWAPELVKLCVDSPNFSGKDVISIGMETNDPDVREKALLSPKITGKQIADKINADELDMYQAEVALRNPNIPKDWYWTYSQLWVTKATVHLITPAAAKRLEEYNLAKQQG